ncbi:HWE histidine kinase domain-containing protein [Paracraurococcus ruber]|nr:HWE histidine kinase domain-containing protein [Paracraurococcus ruber]
MLDEIRAALMAGRPFRGETLNYRKDGTEYLVEWLMTPVLTGAGISRWIAAQRDVTETRRTERQRLRLAAEVNHRVNNTLAAVQSVAAQTARRAETAVEFKAAFQERLRALARVHRLLARHHWAGASLAELAATQVAPHAGGDGSRLLVTGPEVSLRPGAAVALGMALAELAANAAKHGALSVASGHVRLQWHVEPGAPLDRLCLRWTERDGPPVPEMPRRRGFGFRFVEHGLAHELRAETRLAFERAGFQCQILLPLNAVRV